MRHETLKTAHTADGAIAAYRIAKYGDADGDVAQAAAATDKLLGVVDRLGASAAGARCEVVRAGIAEVEFGGTVTRGQLLTADADGKAVAATRAGLVQTIIAGGAAGAHTVTGILATDTLVSVVEIDGTDASETYADLTAEFSISGADEIDNAGGTATTGSGLLVTYRRAPVGVVGRAEVSGVAGDIGSVFIAPTEI